MFSHAVTHSDWLISLVAIDERKSERKCITEISAFPERLPYFWGIAELLFFLTLFALQGCVRLLSGEAQLICHLATKGDATVQTVVLSNRSIFQYFFLTYQR